MKHIIPIALLCRWLEDRFLLLNGQYWLMAYVSLISITQYIFSLSSPHSSRTPMCIILCRWITKIFKLSIPLALNTQIIIIMKEKWGITETEPSFKLMTGADVFISRQLKLMHFQFVFSSSSYFFWNWHMRKKCRTLKFSC